MQIPSGDYERPATRVNKYISNRIQAFQGTITDVEEGKSEVKKTPFLGVTFADAQGATTNRRYYTSKAAIGMLYELADHCGIKNPEKGFNTKKLLNKKVAVVMKPPSGTGKYFEACTKLTLDDAESYAEWLQTKNAPAANVQSQGSDIDDEDVPFTRSIA